MGPDKMHLLHLHRTRQWDTDDALEKDGTGSPSPIAMYTIRPTKRQNEGLDTCTKRCISRVSSWKQMLCRWVLFGGTLEHPFDEYRSGMTNPPVQHCESWSGMSLEQGGHSMEACLRDIIIQHPLQSHRCCSGLCLAFPVRSCCQFFYTLSTSPRDDFLSAATVRCCKPPRNLPDLAGNNCLGTSTSE